MELRSQDLKLILSLVADACGEILKIYSFSDLKVILKKNNSPLTLADKASHNILSSGLKKLYPEIPLISEEAKAASYKKRKNWPYFWLIDPLDGTKEFIAKNGEFTVNLALIKNNTPVLGVVALPVKKIVYFAYKGKGAYKKEGEGRPQLIKAKKNTGSLIILARTRSHKNKKEDKIASKLKPVKTIYVGSSLKFCLVAEGKADVYFRGGPTMEWDTAAGQCIAAEAGAKTYTLGAGPFLYNKKSLLNPGLICTASQKINKNLNFIIS